MLSRSDVRKYPFLIGVFLITFSILVFQILQTRILSVIAWYYLAFFAISVAMLGMTVGAVWVYVRRDRFECVPLTVTLTNFAMLTAVAMPASVIVQYCLITTLSASWITIAAWSLLLAAMALPYVFSGVAVSLALTRSPFPAGQVYGADLVGAALGCLAVIGLLNYLDAPTAVFAAGTIAGCSAVAFAISGGELQHWLDRPRWQRPGTVMRVLLTLTIISALGALKLEPILVKDQIESRALRAYERWNSYSRVIASIPVTMSPPMWGPSPTMPANLRAPMIAMNIDGSAGTNMFHYDGTPGSISFLQYDIVGLAYRLPDIHKAAVIGVGGGRDIMTAHLYGVQDITGVELNQIFVDLHTKEPFYRSFSNLTLIPNLKLHVDDARSWFASTHEKFDLVEMSMADTWAATGAGAFSLSENGLYTLEGWRAFLHTLNDNGIFTVSRWYGSEDINETGRMIGLATAALLDAGVKDPREHIYVATTGNVATLVLSKSPFTAAQLDILNNTVRQYGFTVLMAPDYSPQSALLQRASSSTDLASLNSALDSTYLDLTVPTDSRPFFFNELRLLDFHKLSGVLRLFTAGGMRQGILLGNVVASLALLMILSISAGAVVLTILMPLRSAARECSSPLATAGSLYFGLIGMGFMLAEISLLEYFSVYLGHPVYSLSVGLFSLILSSGLGSLASEKIKLNSRVKFAVWGAFVVAYLVTLEQILPIVFQATTGRERIVRIGVSLAALLPLGFLLGFAFPTGLRMVEAVDSVPTPWFWGINGAAGVLASVVAVLASMSLGINVTLLIAAGCYLLLIPASFGLHALKERTVRAEFDALLAVRQQVVQLDA